jgi:hypothetical protein
VKKAYVGVEYLAESFWWYSAGTPWSSYQSHVGYIIVQACVDQLKIPDLVADLRLSYDPLKISQLCFDGLLLLTNDCDTGIKGLCLFWRRILEGKEEERWKRGLGTCQIRQGDPYFVTRTARTGRGCEGSIQERKWIF